MTKKIIISVLIVALTGLMALSGCQRQQEPESVTISSLFPLQEGNYWKYTGYGNEFADMERKVLFRENDRVQLIESNPGTTLAVIIEVSNTEMTVVYSREEFYEETNILDQESIMQQVILKEPVEVGQSWEGDFATYTIKSMTETVETEAGVFSDCVMIEISYPGGTGVSFSYYKPGLGLVLQEYVDTENDYVVSSVLNDFFVTGFSNQ